MESTTNKRIATMQKRYPRNSFSLPGALQNRKLHIHLLAYFTASILLLATFIAFNAVKPVQAQQMAWEARHSLTSTEYQNTFNTLIAQGYRLVYIDAHTVNGEIRYAAIWEQRTGPAWEARHDLSEQEYQTLFDSLSIQGYMPIVVSGYENNGQEYYAAIWEQRVGANWQARHGLTSAEYQTAFDTFKSQGYWPMYVTGYNVSGQDLYAATWEPYTGVPVEARHDRSEAAHQADINTLQAQGYRLTHISAYSDTGAAHYTSLWEQSAGLPWVTRRNLTPSEYQAAFDELKAQGYRPVAVSGYAIGTQSYYAALWIQDSIPTPTPTLTHTPTSTVTSTFTPAFTPTITPSHTPVFTPTFSPTFTPTFTPTFPSTPTPTGTFTPTVTETIIPSNTPVDSPTSAPPATVTPTVPAPPSATATPIGAITPTATPPVQGAAAVAIHLPVAMHVTLPNDADLDGMADPWEIENNLDPADPGDASLDPDADALVNRDEYRNQTDPFDFDTDDDLLPDGFEANGGLDPLAFTDINSDPDVDQLKNFDELVYSTHPNNADTDGDGTIDGVEVSQGSDPNSAEDGGNAPPPGELVDIRLIVGDPSSSHSERYNLIVGPITHQAPEFGVVAEAVYQFRTGQTYPIHIIHNGSCPDNCYPTLPDYDYYAAIEAVDPNTQITIDDPDGILGDHNESNPFYAEGKVAHLTIGPAEQVRFIDEVAEKVPNDSDNYFLRVANTPQSVNLYYEILPEDLNITNVQINLYTEETNQVAVTLEGAKEGAQFKTGTNLHVPWQIDQLQDIGFYRAELVVTVDGRTEPIRSPIDDADIDMPGWQAPDDGLGIHDLVWKHRPVVFLHADENSGPSDVQYMLDNARALVDVDWLNDDMKTGPLQIEDLYKTYTIGTPEEQKNADTIDAYIDIKDEFAHSTSSNHVLYYYTKPDSVGIFVQYWHFEMSSGVEFSGAYHEGDWEMFQIAIPFDIKSEDANTNGTPNLDMEPVAATASQHYYAQTLKWMAAEGDSPPTVQDQDYIEKIGYRPVIFVALNGHGTYFRSGEFQTEPFTPASSLHGYGDTQLQYEEDLIVDILPNDVTARDTNYQYELKYLENEIRNWQGHWGESSVQPPEGPRSPNYRGTGGPNPNTDDMMMQNPKRFHNRFVKNGQEFVIF